MKHCRTCHKANTNGTKFCSKKCRTEWTITNKRKYKKFMEKHGDVIHCGAVYDYEGNYGGNQ